jgi:hypothetical protein
VNLGRRRPSRSRHVKEAADELWNLASERKLTEEYADTSSS